MSRPAPAADESGLRSATSAVASTARPRARGSWPTRNPFLILASLALAIRFGLPLVLTGFAEGLVGHVWRMATYFLVPFSTVATWIDPYLRGFPEWVDLVGTLALGLTPYLALDAVYRRSMRHRRTGA